MKNESRRLSPEQSEEILKLLKARFEKNMDRHKGLKWSEIKEELESNTEKLCSVSEMERNLTMLTGGFVVY